MSDELLSWACSQRVYSTLRKTQVDYFGWTPACANARQQPERDREGLRGQAHAHT
jgi:hypothetical protein